MARKANDTTVLNVRVSQPFNYYRKIARERIMDYISMSDLQGKTIYDIAEIFFDAGYWNGALGVVKNKKIYDLTKQIAEEIKKQNNK